MSASVIPEVTISDSRNGVREADLPVHDWYRFVLSFPPHLVREYMNRFGVAGPGVVLDPFCGTGTTIVEAKKLGLRAVGIEASPMAHFATQTKTDWNTDPLRLRRDAKRIARAAMVNLTSDGLTDSPSNKNARKRLRALPDNAASLLITDSISPAPLHKVLVLIDHIRKGPATESRDLMLLALARLLPTQIGNLKFGPEVGLGNVKIDVSVIEPWLSVVEKFADDLNELPRGARSRIVRSDARHASLVLRPGSVNAVFTSPPYPNEKDYTRTTRLESVILGFYEDKQQLRMYKQSLLRSNTRNIYVADTDASAVAGLRPISSLAAQIEERRLELGKTSGFEKNYHKVVLHYFGGMALHLAELRTRLKPGAHLGYVVGDQASFFRIMIRTGQLLADVAESLGYTVESLDLFRTRLSTVTRNQLREEVLVLRWDGMKDER